MYTLLAWLEASPLGHAMRDSGVWTYPLINLAHILGVAALFGSILVLDLRLLGLWRRIELSAIADPIAPVAAGGFMLAAASGICLISTNALDYVGNPYIYIKFPAIGLGVLNVFVLRASKPWREQRRRKLTRSEQQGLAAAGAISLICWLTAVGAGRLIGYW